MKTISDPPETVQPGVFIAPAGAQLRSVRDEAALIKVWEEVNECFGYPKPDGWRIQVHKVGEQVHLFSRSGKDWAEQYPTIVKMIRNQIEDNQVVLDTELVGFDLDGSHLEPSKLRDAPKHHCYLLDALYLQGRSLIHMLARNRVALIWEYLGSALHDNFSLAEYTPIASASDLIGFYQKCRERKEEGFDGAIIKQLGTPYFIDVLKIKPEETIDAVVVGAHKNKQQEIITLLLAVPSYKSKSWIPIAKVARKNTDWDAIWPNCQLHVLDDRPHDPRRLPTTPDIRIAPKVVVTIKVTTLQPSKNYQINASSARECVLREDKGPSDATSFEQVLQMAGQSEYSPPLRASFQQLSLF